MQLVEAKGADAAAIHLQEGLQRNIYKPSDFSLRDLAEALVTDRDGNVIGREWVRALGPQKSGGLTLLESQAVGVDLSRFSNITGQIFYNRVLEGYKQEAFALTSLIGERQSDLSGERIPGVTGFTDTLDDDIAEGMPYPQIGFNEDYIDTPATTKKGRIIGVNKETIFFDRTQQVLKQAGQLGELLARRKEKMIADCIAGIVNNYKWRGTSYNTYQTTSPWINVKTGVDSSNTSFDWTAIDAAEQLFANMLEPNTNEPIVIDVNTIVHTPARRHIMRRVLRATTVQQRTNNQNQVSEGPNTLDPYNLVESKFLYQRLLANGVSPANAANYWFMGDFKRAFEWVSNWPITVVQAPSNSEPEFTQDIVLRWKASERGVCAVIDPRYVVMVKNV
jgi:hypothetical protein